MRFVVAQVQQFVGFFFTYFFKYTENTWISVENQKKSVS